jgi:hypothetical protein
LENLICKNEGILNKWISVFRESDLQYQGRIRILTILTTQLILDEHKAKIERTVKGRKTKNKKLW